MKVTVLMAARNGLPWVREAIASVLAQTHSDFELLIVDDASTDGTAEAAAAFGDPRIRVLANELNLGQVPSLNRGLREARGEYVARLDADDVCLPDRLERQVAVLERDDTVALVGTWLDVVDERGRLWSKLRGRVRDYPEFLFAILADRYPWGHPSLMFRRDVVLALGGYDETLAPSEDKDLYRRLALDRREARCVEAALVRYRRHERQLSQEQSEVQLRHDRASQERFLAELVGPGDAARMRLLLAKGRHEPELLDGAQRRLGLSDTERDELESLLTRRRVPRLSGVAPSLRTRSFGPMRSLARRSRALRQLYARLIGR